MPDPTNCRSCAEMFQRICALNEELQMKRNEIEIDKNRLCQMTQIHKELDQSHAELQESGNTVIQLRKDLDQSLSELHLSDNNVIRLQKELDQSCTELQESDNKVIQLRKMLDKSITELQEFDKKAIQLQQELDESRTALQTSDNKVIRLHNDLEQSRTVLQKSDNKAIRLHKDLEQSRTTLQKSDSKAIRLQKLVERSSKVTEQQRSEIFNLNQEVDHWKSKVKIAVVTVDNCVQTDYVQVQDVPDASVHPNVSLPVSSYDCLEQKEVVSGVQMTADSPTKVLMTDEEHSPVQMTTDSDQTHVVEQDNSVVLQQEHLPSDTSEPVAAWVHPTDEREEGELESEEPQSLAESLREAAEAAQQQTGFVFDDSTGLYYDKVSGYYYDAEKSLYYEPFSGTYYSFNTETNSYAYHSQADFSTYSEEAYTRYCQNITGTRPKQKKKKKKKESDVSDQVMEKVTKRKKKDKKNTSKDKTDRRKRQKKDDGVEPEQAEISATNEHREKHRHKTSRKQKERIIDVDLEQSKNKCTKLEPNEEKLARHDKKKSSKRKKSNCRSSDEVVDDDVEGKMQQEDRKKYKTHSKTTASDEEKSEDICDNEHVYKDTDLDHKSDEEYIILSKISADIDEVELHTEVKSNSEDNIEKIDSVSEIVTDDVEVSSTSDELDTSDSDSDSSSTESSSSSEDDVEEVSALHYPPCIRLIVTESVYLDPGSLYIIPYTGGTMGREESLGHTLVIPDVLVSKMHCSFNYNDTERRYEVKDHASQNGTLLNDIRLSESHQLSEPYHVSHMDVLQIGGTKLQLHIHAGNQTCDDCEPGLLQTKQAQKCEEVTETAESKQDKEVKRRQEIKKIRKKYGLASAPFEHHESLHNPLYQDRSSARRVTKGSDNPYQKDDVPASVHRAISTDNKGHKLLAKMGWKEGDSLGKSQEGIKQPIQAEIRSNRAAGLGSSLAHRHSLDNVAKVKVTERWTKAQHRYIELEKQQGQGHREHHGHDSNPLRSAKKPNRQVFLKGSTETFEIEKTDTNEAAQSEHIPFTVTPTCPNVSAETSNDMVQDNSKMTVKWNKGKVTQDQGPNSIFDTELDSDENG